MKYIFTLLIFNLFVFAFGQQKDFQILWENSKFLENDFGKIKVPGFDEKHFSYTTEKGLVFFAQWNNNAGRINEKSVVLSNVNYSSITPSELFDLNKNLIPKEPILKIYNTSARGKRGAYIEISPIVNQNGVYKKITSFSISYSSNTGSTSFRGKRLSEITSSVLSSGEWYRFYIDKSGIFQLTKSFLSSLGINTNAVDPRTIKIYGNGGRMLPLSNAENYPFDVVENTIKFVGEEDGSFDNGDFILFYGEGPTTYSEESNTNLNLYVDKTYYYVNISSGNGKRIQSMPVINQPADVEVTTFQDYQFYEIDEYNLAKLGRRWFGDRFDIENQKTYNFNFPNHVASEPARFNVAVGAVSETETSMIVTVNGNQVSTLNLNAITEGSILGSSASFVDDINISSDNVTVVLDYINNGNPSANGYLDYINIEATRQLSYVGDQLRFMNRNVANSPGIAQYNISNTASIREVWDITDRFNVQNLINTEASSTISFKAPAGELRNYIAFAYSDVHQPKKDAISTVANQDLKGTIFNGASQGIDYIILAPTQFVSQAERLAQINRDQNGLVVKVVDLQAIYNEFSTGSQDIAALRNFVKYVYDVSLNPNNGYERQLKYLCLFGDGSYDYKDRLNNNTNLVPSWYTNSSFSLTSSFVSDDFYCMMDDNEGTMGGGDRMDIAVGRILAEDVQRAKEMVDKIESYYQPDAFGSWRNNLLLISDDVDIAWEKILQETTDGIGTTVEAEKPFMNVVKIHTDAFQQEASSAGNRYPQVNEAIKDAIEVGALVVNYFGHGGEDGLAKERIFDKNDAQEINNICKFNLFVTVTCEYTKFDDPGRPTAGEYTFWNKNGGATALITTTRQIFVTVGVSYNEVLDDYLFAFGSNDYPSIGEALRLTKTDDNISGISQKRLVFLIGDPAMKLAFPKPDIRLTQVNDVPISQPIDTLKALSYAKLAGEVVDTNGNVVTNFNGTLTATVFDKPIERQTLANDGITENGQQIKLDFTTLGEVLFKGQASIENGQFEFDFIVPRDIGIPVGNGKVSFYAQNTNSTTDKAGSNFDISIGGINENAPEDNVGPVINLFMNDENFVSGGITNESPTLLVKLQDENGINTASGIGHDITAILDGDETNPFVLNDYYQANVDDYTNGVVSYAFRDLEPGIHTLTLKAWDVYNNSSTAEILFNVFDKDEELVIDNVLNYPNPFVNYTEFWFNHNSAEPLDISVQIFTVSGKLVRTLNGQTSSGNKGVSSLSKDIVWDGRDDFGDKIGKGVYVYKLKVKSNRLNKQVEKIQKLVIL
ncbi:type IX secretion system sortase PorU [Winogradskyella alexanderae]|uniref:Type IX secretion system sortase PorU n=1 Tax=Winogradskyella alexanderae TaxID=2877123 RepID=A0ABS7XXM4_9FLAO|nr:type IX secretion system sortase PorU [Winogradskyella alexanderae]MCA0133571.1 type IX secretion system sortase PorU [Winogradskyella alexanderae]